MASGPLTTVHKTHHMSGWVFVCVSVYLCVCVCVWVCVFLCFSVGLRQNFGPAFCGILEFWKFLKGLIHYAIMARNSLRAILACHKSGCIHYISLKNIRPMIWSFSRNYTMNSVRFVFSRRNTPHISLKNIIPPMIWSFSWNYTMNSVRFVFPQRNTPHISAKR